jgi:hypothetical protein
MLLSAVPYGLKTLAELSEDTPIFCFSASGLDEMLLEDENIEGLENDISDGLYFGNILPAIQWWIDVSKALTIGRGDALDLYKPEFKEHRANLITLVNDALSAYAAALAEAAEFSDKSSCRAPASIELLKRYRLFTWYVRSFAREVWPGVDLGWLENRA